MEWSQKKDRKTSYREVKVDEIKIEFCEKEKNNIRFER